MNLIKSIQEEIKRNEELLELYQQIPTGVFGAAVIKRKIQEANNAIASGDVVRMIAAYKELGKSK